MPDWQKFEQEGSRQEVRHLTVMAMRPDMHPRDLHLVKCLERSARAEVKLRLKHLRWLRQQSESA